MPVYEYVCKSCGHHLEVSQSFKDAPLTTCPVCGGELRKVFSSVGIMFKGSGFYRTDSRNGKSTSSPASESKTETKSESASSTSSDSGSGSNSSSSSSTTPAKAAAAS